MTRALRVYATACTVGMFLVVVMGALVAQTGSAHGCGRSWPLCNGHLTPAWAFQSLIEYSHRAAAGMVGLMVVALGMWAWRLYGRLPEVRTLALTGIAAVCAQSLLGAAAVLWPQSAPILALHFGLSLTAFAAVLLLTIALPQRDQAVAPARMRPQPTPSGLAQSAWWLLVYTYLVVYLGAYVASSHSGLTCLGWPLCNGRVLPSLQGAVGIVWVHRLAALILLLWSLRCRSRVVAVARERSALRVAADWVVAALMLQVLSGALLVWTHLSVAAALLHSSLVCLLFGAEAFLWWQSRRSEAKGQRLWTRGDALPV